MAEVWSGDIFRGCGATCKNHRNPHDGPNAVCKKAVTVGSSGLSKEELMLRLKRWLIAGLDDDGWEEEDKRDKHVSMGGRFMRDFAEGFSEEMCDRIANGTLNILDAPAP